MTIVNMSFLLRYCVLCMFYLYVLRFMFDYGINPWVEVFNARDLFGCSLSLSLLLLGKSYA